MKIGKTSLPITTTSALATLEKNVTGFENGYYMIVVTDAAGLASTASVLLQ